MDTPRARSPRPPAPLSKPTSPLPPPPPTLSATASPSHEFSFAFPSSSSSPFGGHLPPISMSRTPVGRVGSDLSHHNHARTSHHQTTRHVTGSKERDRDRAKNRASPFFSGLGGAWRKESGSHDATGRQAEEKRKDTAKRALDVGQWVKRYMAAMVEQLRFSFSRQAEKERREQRRKPHSFTGHGPNAPREMREREWWRRRRGQLSSAPASLRVSPANSGHLSVGGSVKVSTSSDESTMEELQSAIEAAIAHCKNSPHFRGQADDGRRGDSRRLQ
ncbi:probable BRI1 kinase inhibitor 1 [Phragmites australis]|uniref:probable BRI1 kinase inhibitor 1 n=1 Tax=Phragmites australis TaxID=29695 RepID=UPI002D79800F|nr:probable BRI1 kinase inhibitor 1 [Phragmites australis]